MDGWMDGLRDEPTVCCVWMSTLLRLKEPGRRSRWKRSVDANAMEEIVKAKLGVGVQGGADAVAVDGGRVELDGFADVRGKDGVGV